MDTEPDVGDRRRFAADFRGRGTGPAHYRAVADARAQLWSPLARQFADMGRDLFAGATVADVLGLVVDFSTALVQGASMASVTTRAGDELSTSAHTDPLCAELDALQQSWAEGPALRATDEHGTGFGYSADLASDPAWLRFGPRAAERGMRSVLTAAMLPHPETGRRVALTLWSTEPRGLAAADPDVVLVLAAYAAVAVDAAGMQSPATARIREPLRSSDVIVRAADAVIGNRDLPPEEAYDVLWRASRGLVEAWRG